MTISQNPPALPGQLYPVLQDMDNLLSATSNTVDSLSATVTGQASTINTLTTSVNSLGSTVSAMSLTVLDTTSQINALNAKPYASGYLTSFTIGANKSFTLTQNRGITNGGTSLTIITSGVYKVTLTCAKDTNPAIGGYLWMMVNMSQQPYPAICYGLYTSSTSTFLVPLNAGASVTFDIAGNAMWDAGSTKSTHFTLECLN